MKHNRLFILFAGFAILGSLNIKAQDAVLIADGNSAATYSLITERGFNYEVPDVSRSHAEHPFQHIQQEYDKELKENVFTFYSHALIDDDRGIATITDRERTEIKTDSKSPNNMVGQEGETIRFTWKFRIPEGFKTTQKFTHLHQIKGINNAQGTAKVSSPLFTITACTVKDGSQKLQLRYFDRSTRRFHILKEVDLNAFLGTWVSVTETMTLGTNTGKSGTYSLEIRRVSDGKRLMEVNEEKGLDLWLTDCIGVRPKWGIYRSVGENRSLETQLRDEVVRFADFKICKVNTSAGISFPAIGESTRWTCDLQGIPTDANQCGVYIKDGRKYTGR